MEFKIERRWIRRKIRKKIKKNLVMGNEGRNETGHEGTKEEKNILSTGCKCEIAMEKSIIIKNIFHE